MKLLSASRCLKADLFPALEQMEALLYHGLHTIKAYGKLDYRIVGRLTRLSNEIAFHGYGCSKTFLHIGRLHRFQGVPEKSFALGWTSFVPIY